MVGKLFIDGLDAFSEYGIFVEQYGYKALVQMPSFKKLNSTEWPEYDGEETDLSNPILDSKTFSIPFCITDILSASDLFEVLSDGAYHIFDFAELGITPQVFWNGTAGNRTPVMVSDFAVIDTGPRIGETYDCVRTPIQPGQGLFADGFESP